MLANASPRNPYVPIDERSSKSFNFDVVNRSHRMGRSSRCLFQLVNIYIYIYIYLPLYCNNMHSIPISSLTSIPCPLSVIWRSLRPPSLTRTSIDVAPASTAFSINSFRACIGATMISPAAILLTTSGSNAWIVYSVSAPGFAKKGVAVTDSDPFRFLRYFGLG